MAKSVQIFNDKGVTKIIVDGHEIHDVVKYKISEKAGELPVLTLKLLVWDNSVIQYKE